MDTSGNYIRNQFCSYEIALKLKELGFDEKCIASYYTNIKENNTAKYDVRKKLNASFDYNAFTDEDDSGYIRNSDKEYYISVPLWQQCIDWFRKKYEISIEILYEGGLHSDTFEYSYQIFSNYSIPKSEKMKYYKCREQAILKAIELCQKEK